MFAARVDGCLRRGSGSGWEGGEETEELAGSGIDGSLLGLGCAVHQGGRAISDSIEKQLGWSLTAQSGIVVDLAQDLSSDRPEAVAVAT
jgi:hypothetical protein